jgi:hypothetical protein
LFKGIIVYNIIINGNKIKKMFFKIENKQLIINLDMIPHSSKQKIKLYKISNYLKLLKFIKKLQLTTPSFQLFYKKNFFILKKSNIQLKGFIKFKDFSKLEIIIPSFEGQNFKLENINLILDTNYLLYQIKGFLYFNQSLIMFNGTLNPYTNKLKLNIYGNNILTKYKNIFIDMKILNISSKIDFNTLYMKSTLTLKNGKIYDNNLSISIQNVKSKFKFKKNILSTSTINDAKLYFNNQTLFIKKILVNQQNNNLFIYIYKATSPKIKTLNNIEANNIYLNTNIKNFYKNKIEIKSIKAVHKKYIINLNKININSQNKNLIYINIKNGKITYKKNTKLIINDINFTKHKNKINYIINSTKIFSKRISFTGSQIKGDNKIIINKIIKGIFDGFNFKIINNKFLIPNNIFTSQKIIFNNLNINKLKIDFNKKYLTFYSKEYFDNRINNILKKELNISIPITQIGGKNNILGTFYFNKNLYFNINILSKKPILKINNLLIKALDANVTITPIYTQFQSSKSFLKINKDLNLSFKGKGKVDYKTLTLKFQGTINKFIINPILNIKNLKESLKFNIRNMEIFLKNTNLYINLNRKNIIINNLKPLLPYTPLKDIIENGLLFISFAKNITILSYLKTKLPLFYIHNNKPIKNLNQNQLDKLMLRIKIKNKITTLYNNFIQLFMDEKKLILYINNIDINLFSLEKIYYNKIFKKTNSDNFQKILINLQNSNLLYKKHKFLSQKAEIKEINQSIYLKSHYKNSKLYGYTKNNYFLLEGKNFTKEEFNAFIPNLDFIKDINIDFTLVKSPDNFFIGTIYINKAVINKLKTINNVIAFLNTIPSLLSLSSPGFSSKGYKIKKGFIKYLLYKKIFYIKQAKIIGQNIDFISKGYIDLDKNQINLKIKAILKLKLKKIPIIGKGLSYLLLGKDGNIQVNIIVKGNLNNPQIKKDLGKNILPNPLTIFKRTITLPFNLF